MQHLVKGRERKRGGREKEKGKGKGEGFSLGTNPFIRMYFVRRKRQERKWGLCFLTFSLYFFFPLLETLMLHFKLQPILFCVLYTSIKYVSSKGRCLQSDVNISLQWEKLQLLQGHSHYTGYLIRQFKSSTNLYTLSGALPICRPTHYLELYQSVHVIWCNERSPHWTCVFTAMIHSLLFSR